MTVALTLAASMVALLARAAFRRGLRRDTRRLPPALGCELRTHKLECLGEPLERVELELRLLLGDAPVEHGAVTVLRGGLRDPLPRAVSVTRSTGTGARRS